MTETGQQPIRPGVRIRVYQRIERREGDWENEITGTVVDIRPEKTGSWFAHGKDDRLWLYRIQLRKSDGEMTTVAVDQHTRYEVLSDGEAVAG